MCLLSRNLTLLASCRSFPPKPFHAFLQPSVQSTATQRSSFSATPRQALMSGFVSTQKASSPSSLSPAGAVTAAPEGVIPQQASDTQSPPAGQVARRSGVATPSRSRLPPPPPALPSANSVHLQNAVHGYVLSFTAEMPTQLTRSCSVAHMMLVKPPFLYN